MTGTQKPSQTRANSCPLAASTCGDCSQDLQDIVEELGRLKASESQEDAAAEQEGTQTARKVGRVRREISTALQRALFPHLYTRFGSRRLL